MWGLLTVLAAVVAVLMLSGSRNRDRVAPALPQRTLAGRVTTLASLRGRPALIDFVERLLGPQTASSLLRAAQSVTGGGPAHSRSSVRT